MTPREFKKRLQALREENMFAARVVAPFARRLSGQSIPDQESLLALLNDAMHEAIPADVPARWLVVDSIRKDMPEILRLARELLLISAAETLQEQERKAAEAAQEQERKAAEAARRRRWASSTGERCPRCGFTYEWDSSERKCFHCGHQRR